MTRLDIALTNVAGLGAVQLTQSLLPALEDHPGLKVERIFLPDRGPLATYRRRTLGPAPLPTVRRLPNAASRLVECVAGGRRFAGDTVLLVLGDVPLRTRSRQVLFVQTPHMFAGMSTATGRDAVKFAVMRAVFRLNAPRVARFIVQSSVMRETLMAEYRIDAARIAIIQQPPPEWLRAAPVPPRSPRGSGSRLRLFYPAAGYPHKNHDLLRRVDPAAWRLLVEHMAVTLDRSDDPGAALGLDCVGRLGPAAMLRSYATSDALVFLSTAESYGFPLIEAMWLGLPIIAADRGYAHALCGDQAIYFDDADPVALVDAIRRLRDCLDRGWYPDWGAQRAALPNDWAAVAAAIAEALVQA